MYRPSRLLTAGEAVEIPAQPGFSPDQGALFERMVPGEE